MLAVIVAGGVLAGCGDDGPSKEEIAKDRRQVAFTVTQSFMAKSPKNECATYTSGLVREAFGGLKACLAAARPSEMEPETVKVGDLKLDGGEARAFVALRGNGQSGIRGRVWLRKDGEWQIERFSSDLLRSMLVTGLKGAAYADEPVLSSSETRRCARLSLEGLSDARVRAVAYNAMRPVADSGSVFNDTIVRPCLVRQRPGRALLRREFEAGVADGGRAQSQSRKQIRCVRGQLRKTVSSRLIAEDAVKSSAELDPEIAKAIDRATSTCT